MGIVIKRRDLGVLDKSSLMMPIIYCDPGEELINRAISLNIPLAEKLLVTKPKRRAMRMEQCLQEVLDIQEDDVVIKDFDVLFHPDYQVDVLRILIAQYKVKPFAVIWPGKYEDEKLIYAEEGYRDYKVFEIEKYDVTCVV